MASIAALLINNSTFFVLNLEINSLTSNSLVISHFNLVILFENLSCLEFFLKIFIYANYMIIN